MNRTPGIVPGMAVPRVLREWAGSCPGGLHTLHPHEDLDELVTARRMLGVDVAGTAELLPVLAAMVDDGLDARFCRTRPEINGQPPEGGLGHHGSPAQSLHLSTPVLLLLDLVSLRRASSSADGYNDG